MGGNPLAEGMGDEMTRVVWGEKVRLRGYGNVEVEGGA